MPRTVFDKSTKSTRLYRFADGQRVAVGASSAMSAAIDATEVTLHATTDSLIRVGAADGADVTASNAAGSLPLLAGEKFTLQVPQGAKIAVIRMTADGFLFILPVEGEPR